MLQLPKTCGIVTQDSSVTAPKSCGIVTGQQCYSSPRRGTVTQDSSVTAHQAMCYCNSTAVLLQLPKSWAIVTGQCSLIHEVCSDLTCVAGTACRSGRPVV